METLWIEIMGRLGLKTCFKNISDNLLLVSKMKNWSSKKKLFIIQMLENSRTFWMILMPSSVRLREWMIICHLKFFFFFSFWIRYQLFTLWVFSWVVTGGPYWSSSDNKYLQLFRSLLSWGLDDFNSSLDY